MAPETLLTPRRRRPWLLSLLFWALILWSFLGWLRFARALLDRDLILTLLSPGLFRYLVAAGLVWGAVPLPALWGLITGAAWAKPWVWIAAFVPPVFYWFERLLLWQDSPPNTPAMLVLTIGWAGLAVWALRSRRSQQFFEKSKQGQA